FRALALLFKEQREPLLYHALYHQVRLVKYKKGRLEVLPVGPLAQDFAHRISGCLQEWTGERWMVSLASASAAAQPSLADEDEARRQKRIEAARHAPAAAKILEL